ncbi:MAG: sulfotransferase [Solirubrobacterales bacterium]
MSELPPRPENPDLIFVGGTGRSGTHVVSHLLGSHPRYARVPIECRFHCNPQGFPDLIHGRIEPDVFLRKLKKFWWRRIRAGEVAPVVARRLAFGRKVRGLHKIVPRERFDAAIAEFERTHPTDLEGACRNLFLDLLWPLTDEQGKPGLIEMSCFTIAESPTLQTLFPEAKLIHTVRDGRDAASSKVSKRQKRSHPRDGLEGLRWWEGRLRNIERGVGRLGDPSKLLCVSLDDLVAGDRDGVYSELLAFTGLDDTPEMRGFFDGEMSADAAHKERWREGLTEKRQSDLIREYEKVLERLEREGFHCAPQLRAAYERQPA